MVRETRHLWVSNQPEIVREDRIRDHFKRSSEDVSPQSFEQRGSSYYERNSRITSETDQYSIRRTNNFHDLRGRTRERVYRNGPCTTYGPIIERNRLSTWYDTASSSISSISGQGSSPATRSVYGSVPSAVVQPDTSTLYDCQVIKNKNKKSRSGSESPCGGSSSVNATSSHSSNHLVDRGNGGSAASSRSHSRSPSSCSSTNSTSSNSHASSPVSGSDPPLSSTSSTASRSRNLQSAVSAPSQSGNLVVHSEDNRPLAICVRNLPARSSDTSLKDGLFHEYKKHGKVTWVKVVGQNAERYALVCFKKPEDVEKALEVSQDKLFFGCKIEVEPYQGYDVEDNEFRPYEAELDEYHPKSTRTLFIGNLEKDITGSDIRNHFECFGEIIEIDIKKQGMNAYAFCQYSDIVSVVKAMRKMDGEHLGNNRIKLGFGKSMPTNCVWIDGVADSVSENYLTQQFKSYGPITEVVIDRDRKLALVSFEQVQYAQMAVKEMRGASLRGRKLQLDFASRECREKFCSKVDKQTGGTSRFSSRYACGGSSSSGSGATTSGTGSGTNPADAATTAASSSQSRSRASSFSRHGNMNSTSTSTGGTSPAGSACGGSGTSGATSSSSSTMGGAAGSTPLVAGAVGSTTPRGSRSSRIARHPDYEYGTEQRLRSYDEYSQGSGASHDDESYNYANSGGVRPDSPQSRLGAGSLDTLEVSSTSSGRRRCDKSPGDIRNLHKERFQILEQLEECPSSGDELVSPKKRMKFDHSSHHHNHHHTISSLAQSVQTTSQLSSSSASSSAPSGPTSTSTSGIHDCSANSTASSSNNTSSSLPPTNPLIGDSNCDVYSNHSNVTNCSLHYRKCVEVRRLSECSLSLKYGSQLSSSASSTAAASATTPIAAAASLSSSSSNSRRPSTEVSGGASATTTNERSASNMFPSTLSSLGGASAASTSSSSALRHSGSTSSLGQMDSTSYAAPHSMPCKRRRTGASCSSIASSSSTTLANSDSNEHHSSRGRGHQLHSHHSHEASGGESADGSRPGTPLCDERPEVSLSEPRRIPRDKPHEPMMLPLPKFGIQFFQQHRLAAASGGGGQSANTSSSLHAGSYYSSSSINTSSSTNLSSSSGSALMNHGSYPSALLNSNNSHSSLSSTLSSPPPSLTGAARLSAPQSAHHHHHHHHASSSANSNGSNSSSSSSLSHHHHHHHHQAQQPHHHHHQQHHTNFHPPSSSGTPSFNPGEQAPSSPLRTRSLSSNSSDSDNGMMSTSPSIEERLKTLDEMYEIWSGGGTAGSRIPTTPASSILSDHSSSRHKFLELDVNEVKPSEFAKRVLAKKSIFDDDLQRLKNLNDKYEPGDFSNLSRSSLVSTSPGIPNLAATKTPVVGGNPAAKQNAAQSSSVFHSPSVNSLQRMNSPMNSPQAMSPYNSPSPSPVVSGGLPKNPGSQQPSSAPPQPVKSLQYPFPSHPPLVMTPSTPPATPVAAVSSVQTKPKIATTTKSFSLQEKSVTQSPAAATASSSGVASSATTNPNRVLIKSASVPGSTNVGTIKTASSSSSTALSSSSSLPATTTSSKSTDDSPEPSATATSTSSSSRRSSADMSTTTKQSYQKSSTSSQSKKADKAHKQNHRNDNDTKKSKSDKSRSESIDKRKTSFSSEEKDESVDVQERDANERLSIDDERPKKSDSKEATSERSSTSSSTASSTTTKRSEKADRRAEKRREKEEREREEREKKAAAEQQQREQEERERLEQERKEREEREQKEREERERREREERVRQEELARKEREERERREREDHERKEREERERKEREERERERKEREERDRREREERERKEREERERREREERERKEREREEAARREREECLRREREERERKEREEAAKREREERERKEREEALRREREERERRERDEAIRREREERERREKEERERQEREERERREKEALEREKQEREERLQFEREDRERDRLESAKEREEHAAEKRERKDRDEVDRERRERKDRYNEHHKETNAVDRNSHDFSKQQQDDSDDSMIGRRIKDEDYGHVRPTYNHKDEKHHHKDNNNETNSSVNDDHDLPAPQAKRRISSTSPARTAKRRLSSQDSIDQDENPKRMKVSGESRKGLDRFDSKESNRSLKIHKSHNRATSLTKNCEDKLLSPDERCRKDSGFDEKKSKDKEHKKYEKSSSHKHKKSSSTSVEKDDSEMRSPIEKSSSHMYELHDIRSSDDDHNQHHQRVRNKKEHHKEKKRHDHDQEEPHPHRRSSDSKRHEHNRHERKLSSRSEESIQKGMGEKSRSKPPSRKMTQSSNDSDSDEPKKHSIFDIQDEGPYVSMYDKVKARSCKNMQKQQEEMKIKAKFSQLKQCRAKREEKKRSTSYDGDSDSDFDDRPKYKRSGFINSSSDDDASMMNQMKESDSDSDTRRAQYNRARLNELCDGDSSDGGSILGKSVPCKKISSKRNSRSTRIVSDSSDTESSSRVKGESRSSSMQESRNNMSIKQEVKTEDEVDRKGKTNRYSPIKAEKEEQSQESNYELKLEIKEEPQDDRYSSHVSESEANICSGSAVESKDSVRDQLFASDVRKKHKKSKKRQKLASSHASEIESDKCVDIKSEKHSPVSMENVFDELKRESHPASSVSGLSSHYSEKKKHKDRKEKKREKSREEYEKLSKEERHRLKKAKKSKANVEQRLSQDSAILGSSKRSGEKMEDIFGPISDDETQLSMTDSVPKDSSSSLLYESISSSHNMQPVVSAALNPYKQEPLTPKSHTVEENEENKQKLSSHSDRERHRKEKREKKRKERERNREQQHAFVAFQQTKHEDENSVDMDEAGRALEAQLMEDSDNKLTDETTPSTATTHKSDAHDVFRFSDGDENSMEVVAHEKKEHSESHKSKEKKKKKKRSKEERHQKREHHHHSSSTQNTELPTMPALGNKLSIEITAPADAEGEKSENLCKPSPSLPCLLDESPPRKNNSSSDLNLSISPLSRDQPNMISPIPKTPTISGSSKPSECKKKPDKFIPGFDVELDEKISESAVQSISSELTAPSQEPAVVEEPKSTDNQLDAKIDKIEEKSRVVISQEETEDAVAALLGESFGSNTVDYSFGDDTCEIQPEEDVVTQEPTDPIIPEEEAEEMRKAVQSLSSEDIEIKPDTPQSEQDLQIDTDTEDQDEESQKVEEAQQQSSQPDTSAASKVEPSQPNRSVTPANTASVITATAKETKPEKEPTVPTKPAERKTPPEPEKISEPVEKMERASLQIAFASTPGRNSQSPNPMHHQPVCSSPSMSAAPKPLPQSVARSTPNQFMIQPPTISIPEPAFVYPPINVMLSPRGANTNDHRMPSPRQTQQCGSPIGQQPPPGAQFANVRVGSPQSPSVRGNPSAMRHPGQMSPHMVIQQRQLMSPPSTPSISQSQATSSANITLNRIPMTTVLAPISKPIQQTVLPQPNTAHASIITRPESSSGDKELKTIGPQTAVYQSVRLTPTSTSSSPVNLPGKSQSPTIQLTPPGGMKSVIETHAPVQIQQIVPIQVAQAKPNHPTVVLQSPPQSIGKQSPLVQTVTTSPTPQPPGPGQAQQMQQIVKIAQHQNFRQHLMRQQHIQIQQQQHHPQQHPKQFQPQQQAQLVQIQQKQPQTKQPSPQQQPSGQQSMPPTHRIVQQQVLQVHPTVQAIQASQAQQLSKDIAQKIAVPMPGQLGPSPSIQQNVVVVRQPQSPIPSKQQLTGKQQSSPQQNPGQMSTSQPIILQQRQTPLTHVSSPLIFQHNLPHMTTVQNMIHQTAVKVQVPVSQPQEPMSQAAQVTVAKSTVSADELSAQKGLGRFEPPPTVKTTPEMKGKEIQHESVEKTRPQTPKDKESDAGAAEAKKEPMKVEAKSSSTQQQELENVSVIKSQTAATPVPPFARNVFSNVINDDFVIMALNAKKNNVPSVMTSSEGTGKTQPEAKEEPSKESPKMGPPANEIRTEKPDDLPPPEAATTATPTASESEKDANEVSSTPEMEKSEDTHDEEEFDETIESGKGGTRGGKRGGRSTRGSKKATPAPGTPSATTAASGQPATTNPDGGVQTRRGKTAQTGSTRGRKGRGAQSRSPAVPATPVPVPSPVPTPGEKKIRNQGSDQDVYEFHEDSGEETATGKSERPRLILTIKSPGQATPQVVPTKPVTVTTAVAAPLVTHPQQPAAAIAPSAPMTQSQPPPTQTAPEATTPPQKDQKEREEFTTPATNTRKSRRLLEKDGVVTVRNTVDDTIEDVVRNLSSPKMPPGAQTPPRRSTRNSLQVTTPRGTQQPSVGNVEKTSAADARKSPRANRKSKDRKISETSVDSSDEKGPSLDDKASVKPQPTVTDATGMESKPSSTEEMGKDKESSASAPSVIPSATPLPLNIKGLPPNSKPRDPSETLTLIDPVTGLLTVVQHSKEGQYVPVSSGGPHIPANAKVLGKHVILAREDQNKHEQQRAAEPKPADSSSPALQEAPKVITSQPQPQMVSTPPGIQTAGSMQPNVSRSHVVVQQQQAQQVQVHVQGPQPQYVPTSQEQPMHPPSSQAHHPSQPTPQQQQQQQQQQELVHRQSPQVQMQMQQTPPLPVSQSHVQIPSPVPQQSQPPRTHPLKAHMLNSQHNTTLVKQAIISQSVVKVAASVGSQPSTTTTVVSTSSLVKPQQATIVQSNIVSRHVIPGNAPPHGLPHQQSINLGPMPPQQSSGQPVHNLYVNIPPPSTAAQVAVTHSPRIQQTVMARSDPNQPASQQPVQLLHVVSKPPGPGGSGNQTQQIIAQHQPVVVHSNKIQPTQTQFATVVQSGKIIQQGTAIQTTVGGKPQTIQVTMQQPGQGPMSHQQQPQQVQHMQKQQSPTVSVVTHQLGKPIQLQQQPPQQQQSHHQQPPTHSGNPPPSHIVQTGQPGQPQQHHVITQSAPVGAPGKPSVVASNTIHLVSSQQPGRIIGPQHIVSHAAHQSSHPHQPQGTATILQAKPAHQQAIATPTKGVIGAHQSAQIMAGAVPSPPLKQSHLPGQQPVATGGASSLRTSVPPISPQGQARSHLLQPGLPPPAFEAANMHDIGGFGAQLSQSPPPAHQQASPITTGEGGYHGGAIRAMPRDYIMYQQYFRAQPEARIPFIPRSPSVQGSAADPKDMSEVDDAMVASPPLELRRPASGPRTIAVPHSLQSPQDRATDSPQVAQVYVHTRIPHPQYQEVSARYFDPVRQVPAEPPPAHRPIGVVTPSVSNYPPQPTGGPPPPPTAANIGHMHTKMLGRDMEREQREREQREREQREREQRENDARYYAADDKRDRALPRKREANERTSIPQGHTGMPSHDSLVPAMPTPTGRSIQVATPPHASQVPPQRDSLLTLLQRYPLMWQGLLALKTDQAAVQMHFVFGNPMVARGSLPCNIDGSTPPLRIAQRMRLEQTQLEGVAKKMQYENEHCMLLALPCGRNHMDVLQQSRNLQTGFITYLQQKMAAGIVNIPVPGSDQAAYVVHIFPSCDFANENLERAAPDLKHRLAEIAHLLIIIATV